MFKLTNLMMVSGLLLIIFGISSAAVEYRKTNSPFDSADASSSQLLDAEVNFTSLLKGKKINTDQMAAIWSSHSSVATHANDETSIQSQISPAATSLPPAASMPAPKDSPSPTQLDWAIHDQDDAIERYTDLDRSTAQPAVQGYIPDRLVISAIQLDAPIESIHFKEIKVDGQVYEQWLVPSHFAVGWHDTSALVGKPGNTVLNGHHNVYGEVFGDLIKVEVGDLIQVFSGDKILIYQVADKLVLPERFQSLDVRISNANWIMPTTDERLTLVTCWPKDSNTHRVIVVALPLTDSPNNPDDLSFGQ